MWVRSILLPLPYNNWVLVQFGCGIWTQQVVLEHFGCGIRMTQQVVSGIRALKVVTFRHNIPSRLLILNTKNLGLLNLFCITLDYFELFVGSWSLGNNEIPKHLSRSWKSSIASSARHRFRSRIRLYSCGMWCRWAYRSDYAVNTESSMPRLWVFNFDFLLPNMFFFSFPQIFCCRCVLDPGDKIVDCPPTFTMYEFDAAVNGALVIKGIIISSSF